MTQYCTLQEAYQIDSFPRKKKNCAPLKSNASADPYDPFTEQRAREQARISAFETFENLPVSSSKPLARQDQMGNGESTTYKGMSSDYDYYCKNFNICSLEGFDASSGKPKKAPTTKVAPQKDKCSPLEPPIYEYPISQEDKAKFQKALKIALEQMEDSTPPYVPEQRKADMTTVDGYMDDELDTYLTVKDMKAAPKPSAKPAQAPPKELPGFEKESTVSPFEADVKKQGITIPSNYTQTHKLWMDLLLFISSGLLFIFLLEQLYKIALMSGMKKTIQAMDSLIRLKESST
jgi:hypothetical protein